MAQSSFPFDSMDTTETQFSQWARNIGEGVRGLPTGTELKPYGDASGMVVKIPAGQALVRGHYFVNDSLATLAVTSANSTNPRIDSVVLELDPVANTILLKMVDGTAAVSPVAPTLTQTDAGVYQLLLATVYVAAAASNIAASAVTDARVFVSDAYRVSAVAPRGNAIINGGFDIWQRGAGPWPGTGYSADRWMVASDSGDAVRSVSRQSFTPGNAIAGQEAQYFIRWNQSIAGSSATYNWFGQRIEDVRTFAGQTVTISFYAKAAAAQNVTVNLGQNFGSGGSAAVANAAGTHAVTTSWQRFFYTVNLASISGKTIGTGSSLSIEFTAAINGTFTLDLWGVQVEAGVVASPFRRNANSLQGELAACQRYYYRKYSDALYGYIGNGWAFASTNGDLYFQFPVNMRAIPTAMDWSGTAANLGLLPVLIPTITAVTMSPNVSTTAADIILTGTPSSAGTFLVRSNNNATVYFGFSAEL